MLDGEPTHTYMRGKSDIRPLIGGDIAGNLVCSYGPWSHYEWRTRCKQREECRTVKWSDWNLPEADKASPHHLSKKARSRIEGQQYVES